MPVIYRYDDLANRLLTRLEGAVTHAEVTEHLRRLTRDARLRLNCDVLLDLTFVTLMPSADQISETAQTLEDVREFVSFGRCAVVGPEDLTYGLGRMFQGFSWPAFTGIRVFRAHADAINWLSEKPLD